MQNIHEINSSPNIYRGDQNPSNLNDTASGAYDEMYGYAGNDELWSDLATEVKLVGGLGWDYLWVRGSGWGLLQGDEGNDVLDGGFSSKADTLNGGDGDDILGGSAGLFDGDAGDLLDGGNGRDAMYGQLGNDTIFGGAGDDNHIGNMMITAGPRFLQAYGGLYGSWGHDYLDGGSGNDDLNGGQDNDTLIGGTGNDTLVGSTGDDTYNVDSASDVVTELANQGTDTVQASLSYVLGSNLENLMLTGSALTGTGNALANRILGNDAGNTLDGSTGADTLEGGAGDDTYLIDSSDVLIEVVGGGIDSIVASFNYTLGAELENLTLTGSATTGTGNGLANWITGTAGANTLEGLEGNDTLDGASGADTMDGGAGNDTYVVDNAGDVIIEGVAGGTDTIVASFDYTLGAELENLTLMGSATTGTGNGAANRILGNGLANTLDGGAGADTLEGGAGNDTYVVDNAGDVVIEATAAGVDTAVAAQSYVLGANVEILTLTGSALNGTGNASDNVITGNALANVLDGSLGADTLTGGAGNDTYVVDTASDVLIETGADTDTVMASFNYTLEVEFEHLTLTGSAVSGAGNGAANRLVGNGSGNALAGAAGSDTLDGGLDPTP